MNDEGFNMYMSVVVVAHKEEKWLLLFERWSKEKGKMDISSDFLLLI
jgi:hypothetical protein